MIGEGKAAERLPIDEIRAFERMMRDIATTAMGDVAGASLRLEQCKRRSNQAMIALEAARRAIELIESAEANDQPAEGESN